MSCEDFVSTEIRYEPCGHLPLPDAIPLVIDLLGNDNDSISEYFVIRFAVDGTPANEPPSFDIDSSGVAQLDELLLEKLDSSTFSATDDRTPRDEIWFRLRRLEQIVFDDEGSANGKQNVIAYIASLTINQFHRNACSTAVLFNH